MKKIIKYSLVMFFTSIAINAQVTIGKTSVDGSGILDFASGQTGGIILPVVRTLPTGLAAADGTILINAVDLSAIKAQMRQNGAWVDISDAPKNLSSLTLNTTTDNGTGTIIGAQSSTVSGVLVLESNDKALILPKVANAETGVKSPVVGTMVYDLSSNSVAIFDGVKWNFWK